ncbi:hypothetical protein GX563_09910 [Candidatus Bathyarchaeota archaeon]|nr:hypothetical protein [Candidatus Bathyarchaeota archaeon]
MVKYPLTVIKTVDRRRYYDSLQKAGNANPRPIVNFVARCVEQSLDLYLSAVEPAEPKTRLLSLGRSSKTYAIQPRIPKPPRKAKSLQ